MFTFSHLKFSLSYFLTIFLILLHLFFKIVLINPCFGKYVFLLDFNFFLQKFSITSSMYAYLLCFTKIYKIYHFHSSFHNISLLLLFLKAFRIRFTLFQVDLLNIYFLIMLNYHFLYIFIKLIIKNQHKNLYFYYYCYFISNLLYFP